MLCRLSGRLGAARGPDIAVVFQPESGGRPAGGGRGDGLLHGGGGRRPKGADAGCLGKGGKAQGQAL